MAKRSATDFARIALIGFALSLPAAIAHGDDPEPVQAAEPQLWTVTVLTADTKEPLSGVEVHADAASSDSDSQRRQVFRSDEIGRVVIPLYAGQSTFPSFRVRGWCYSTGFPVVGQLPAEWFNGQAPPRNADREITIHLHRGTEVRGRLLLPNGHPAAGMRLTAGVYGGGRPWVSQAYIENAMSHTYIVSDWPNWHASTRTDGDGNFWVTVPPAKARHWIRLGTHGGGSQSIDTQKLATNSPNDPLVRFAPFEVEVNGHNSAIQRDESTGVIDVGDLKLERGVVLRGRVVDAAGQPMPDVHLFTSSERGPYAGRKVVSQEDGTFEFPPMNRSAFTLRPDAHPRDADGQTASRDVRAVLLPMDVNLESAEDTREITIQAVPHVEMKFKWVDNRAQKGAVAYYGSFTLTGDAFRADGSKVRWRGETVKVKRDSQDWLIVKVPRDIEMLKLSLHRDSKVNPFYSDDYTSKTSGDIYLGHPAFPANGIIYGEEPQE